MMTTTIDHHWHEINSADARRRKIRVMQAIFAGAATIATLALHSAAWPGDAETVAASGSVRLVAQANDLPAPALAPVDPQFPQTLLNAVPQTLLNAVGDGGFAAESDDNDNDDSTQQRENEQQDELDQQQSEQNEDETNQATQQAQQQMQQSEQEAEEQNEMAEQQAQQDEQQAQMDEQEAGQ